jgi:IS30 family transposase
LYTAVWAHKKYKECLSESRSGVCVDEKEKDRLDGLLSPLIKKGQSLHHIWAANKDAIMLSEKTLYNYTDYNFFTARNIDLSRKVRYRSRKKKKDSFKVDRSCRIGRSYEDFLSYMEKNPDTPVVEMDSVEGNKGGKVLLTIHFTTSSFMLAYIRDANTSQSVIDIYEDLYSTLENETFKRLFPLILTDIGSEFSNPATIEFDANGEKRTQIFYCDPASPHQKGAIENNHEMIRRIVPQGKSFDKYGQNHIKLMMDHINSYARKKLNDKSPHSLFSFLHGTDVLRKLDAKLISPNDIILKPELLR